MAGIPKQTLLIVALIAGAAAPAIMSVLAYEITQDPSLRPLGRTKNDMAIFRGEVIVTKVIAQISWPARRRTNFTKQELSTSIRNGFSSHGVAVQINLTMIPGDGPITVAYTVGRNQFKPRTVRHLADGVKTAVAAYKMYQRQNHVEE